MVLPEKLGRPWPNRANVADGVFKPNDASGNVPGHDRMALGEILSQLVVERANARGLSFHD